jgi:hypothetical protein
MKNRQTAACAFAIGILVLAGASQAEAQIRQVDSGRNSIGFNLGYFSARSEDARVAGDVLIADISDIEPLAFDISDFNGVTFGGEWSFGLSEYLEGSVGLGYYQNTVHSVYANVVNDNGSEIEQDLKLRTVPITATVRFLPIGRGGVEPYVGAGIGVFNWRYSEAGEFVDTADYSIFRAQYVADGWTAGPVILGGIRFPIADVWTVGGELRYQNAEGDIDQEATDLLGDKIDLGGWSTSFTLNLRF